MVVVEGDALAGIGVQPIGVAGFTAQALDRIHHMAFFEGKGIAQLGHPVDITVEHLQNVGKGHQRLDAGVPIHVFERIAETVALQTLVLRTL